MTRVYVRGWTQREMDIASLMLDLKSRLLVCESGRDVASSTSLGYSGRTADGNGESIS